MPVWLQVAGRMHPLILHFPLVLVILYAVDSVDLSFKKNKRTIRYTNTTDLLLLLAALQLVITALQGLFLSREEGYDAEALRWHKWSGVAVSFLHCAGIISASRCRQKKYFFFYFCCCFGLIIFAGHQGAGITHGQNFLLAPMMPEKKQPLSLLRKRLMVFTHMVKPILETKCESCHNSKKAKGELVMETEALLLKGGKSGNCGIVQLLILDCCFAGCIYHWKQKNICRHRANRN